ALQSSFPGRENRNTCVVPPRWWLAPRTAITFVPETDGWPRRKPGSGKKEKNRSIGVVCLLTKEGLIRVILYLVQGLLFRDPWHPLPRQTGGRGTDRARLGLPGRRLGHPRHRAGLRSRCKHSAPVAGGS